ncbi:MAG TPA: SMP-30/gluconolactonase/LRE family protein [Terriglobia bacterium]|jgi:gluconolactonase
MNSKVTLLAAAGCLGAMVVLGQAPASQTGPGVQAPQDAKYAAFIAKNCKVPPTQARGGGAGRGSGSAAGRGGGAGRGSGGGRGSAADTGPEEYTVTAIPGIIAAGQKWKSVWTGTGNDADGIMATKDGGILAAQNTNSQVMKIDKDGKVTFPYTHTPTAGSIAMNKKGSLFVLERALPQAIEQLEPKRHIFANMINGEPLDCAGGLVNDMVAASNGGVYFTMGGVFYANPAGVITKQGTVAGTNGIVLSPNEKTLYVTGRITPAPAGGGGGSMIAFDIKPDGSLTNERQYAMAGGDGSAVDSQGRLYATGGPGLPGGKPALSVIGTDGKIIGQIPIPRPFITVVFSGKDKKTLYGVFNNQRQDEIFSIQMIAQGYKGRSK